MKVTLEIDPGLFARAEWFAQSQQISLDRFVSDALRKSIETRISGEPNPIVELEQNNGFWVFEERNDIQVTANHVRSLYDEPGHG